MGDIFAHSFWWRTKSILIATAVKNILFILSHFPAKTNANVVIGHRDAQGILATTGDENRNFTLFPYPGRGLFTLQLANNTSTTLITSCDLAGRELITKQSSDNQIQIDMSAYSAGTYLVKVTTDGGVVVKKVTLL